MMRAKIGKEGFVETTKTTDAYNRCADSPIPESFNYTYQMKNGGVLSGCNDEKKFIFFLENWIAKRKKEMKDD